MGRWKSTKIYTTVSTASHSATSCARSVYGVGVHSLSSDKERTKKTDLRAGALKKPARLVALSACRSCWRSVERCGIGFYVFLLLHVAERHGSGFQRRRPLAPFLATSWGAPRSGMRMPKQLSARNAQYERRKEKLFEILTNFSFHIIPHISPPRKR